MRKPCEGWREDGVATPDAGVAEHPNEENERASDHQKPKWLNGNSGDPNRETVQCCGNKEDSSERSKGTRCRSNARELRGTSRQESKKHPKPSWLKEQRITPVVRGFEEWEDRGEEERTTARWRSPRAAVIPNFHLPMRSNEVKNRTYAEDIKALRLITAIKTPYLPDGRFDLEAYDAIVNMQIESGVEGVIVGGTTGEGYREHSNSTREAIHATEQGFAVGMHAALHINPYYGKTSLEGMVSHFNSVLPMGPTIIYNVPSRTGQDIPPAVIEAVATSPNLAGVKECVGNDRVEQYTSKGIVVWSGNDDQCHDSRWDHGATGVVSVTSNLVPGLMRELMFGGKNPSLNAKLVSLIQWLFEEPNPIGLNTAMAQLGVARPIFRLPYVPLPKKKREEFVKIVNDIGRENFVGERDVEALDDDDFILVGRY
nr:4-hydroxy-tetrahydrodipicolinate synthase, chloroplastic [Ipomoea batatas]